MRRSAATAIMLLLMAFITACSQQPSLAPTQATGPIQTTGPAATTGPSVATPAAPAPTTAPGGMIGVIAPLSVQIPDGFKASVGAGFAQFQLPPVQSEARVQAPAIAPDLSNVELNVILSPEQQTRLAQNGFAVSPGTTKEFYELYEQARYDYVPVFVSSDSLLHVYHLLFDKTLRQAETNSFIPLLTRLDLEMLRASAQQYEALAGTPWADAARRNAAYFAVAVKLLNPDWQVPEGLRDLTDPDLKSIEAHSGIGPSAIFPAYSEGEDWSQYVPRGHYTKSEELQRYFTAMMWHGRMTFRAENVTETQQAALLTLAYNQTQVDGQPAAALWNGIYEPTVFFVGRSDDLTPPEYAGALSEAYGQVSDVKALLDEAKFGQFRAAIDKLRPPQILGMVINAADPVVETTKGLRFMGQRFVPDAFVFRQLVDRNVPGRMLPKSLDFFAAIGSDRALGHLQASGDTKLPDYQKNMDKARGIFASYGEEVWTQNLYWSWIYSLRPLLEKPGEGYPQFMRSDAWLDKQLTTALGSWTELKRDTILYAKQVYAERGAGALPPPTPEPPKGYVEPVPLFYARIAALTKMTIDGLDSRGLLADPDKAALEKMAEIAGKLQTMAEKQLRGEALTAEEYEFIRFYGAEIEALTFGASDEGQYGGRGGSPAGGEPLQAAVVADIATDPGGQVLQVGVGRIFDIYVVAPIEGKLVLTKGGVFSHYEFTQPLSDRLTDEKWRAKLDAGDVPPLAQWTSSFMVEQNAAGPLGDTIRGFNDELVKALWETDVQYVEKFLGPEELADTRAYIEQLKGQEEFLGAKRLSLQFLSFDFQDANNAVVTTRERWSDELYKGSPFFERQRAEPALTGMRPPYETVATYTMQKQGEDWIITKIVLNPAQPEFQPPPAKP